MVDLNALKRELDGMSVSELLKYVQEKYPENEELGIVSKKIIIRNLTSAFLGAFMLSYISVRSNDCD